MKTLPEICESCRRGVQALERVIVLLDYAKKRVAEITLRESGTEGFRCIHCVPND